MGPLPTTPLPPPPLHPAPHLAFLPVPETIFPWFVETPKGTPRNKKNEASAFTFCPKKEGVDYDGANASLRSQPSFVPSPDHLSVNGSVNGSSFGKSSQLSITPNKKIRTRGKTLK